MAVTVPEEFRTFCCTCSTYSLSVLNTVYVPVFRWHIRTYACCTRLFLSVLFNDALSYWDCIAFALNEYEPTEGMIPTGEYCGNRKKTCPIVTLSTWWVRIPLGAWMSVSRVCCVFWDGPIAHPEEPYRLVCLSVILKPRQWEGLVPRLSWFGGGGTTVGISVLCLCGIRWIAGSGNLLIFGAVDRTSQTIKEVQINDTLGFGCRSFCTV